jgi:DJ-1/PfpI family
MWPEAVDFVKGFFRDHKPVAAICHGSWLLAEADVIRGHNVTSWPSIKTDLRNAGAEWVEKPVVQDAGLITSRKPDDIPDFSFKMLGNSGRNPEKGSAVVKGLAAVYRPLDSERIDADFWTLDPLRSRVSLDPSLGIRTSNVAARHWYRDDV